MLISYSHQFIFFHIPKTAGNSIHAMLDPYAHFTTKRIVNRVLSRFRLNRHFAKIPHKKFKTYNRHVTAQELQNLIPKNAFSNFYKFAFVRNPWDWQVSLYHYILKTPNLEMYEIVNSLRDFDEYLNWRVKKAKKLQRDFIADDAGNLMVDFVGKFENLQDDMRKVCSHLNLNFTLLPHLNRSSHKDYRFYYTPQTVDLISKAFREDIELFGYNFND